MKLSSYWKQKKTIIIILVVVAVLINMAIMTVKFNITGSHEGLFLLRGEGGALFELKDDIYLGEAYRYIIGINFEPVKLLYDSIFLTAGSRGCIYTTSGTKKTAKAM